MDNCCYIIGVRVNHRVANAVGLQEVLTKYGCNIKLRVGPARDQREVLRGRRRHHAAGLRRKEPIWRAWSRALNAMEGIRARMLEL